MAWTNSLFYNRCTARQLQSDCPRGQNYYYFMIFKQNCLQISKLFNWSEYENKIWIRVEAFNSHEVMLDRAVEGRVIDSCLLLSLSVPCCLNQNDKVSVRINMWGGASLGEATFEVKDLGYDSIKYFPLTPRNQNIIQVQLRTSAMSSRTIQRQSCSRISSISSVKELRNGLIESTSSLKRKYIDTESQLAKSVTSLEQNAVKMTKLVGDLSSIRKRLKDRSQSQERLMSLKKEIQPANLRFGQLVYPFINVIKSETLLTVNSSQSSLRRRAASPELENNYNVLPTRLVRKKYH